ncbi:MAG: hypothetical protein QOI57_3174 [Rubrobacteraceae bacterium]|nr:hypothetical protein [Rubrobacteraceae bacterium]
MQKTDHPSGKRCEKKRVAFAQKGAFSDSIPCSC